MTRANLDAAEDLHQSTTPGPWEAQQLPVEGGDIRLYQEVGLDDFRQFDATSADAEFIVQAHRLWPALVAELRAAQEQLAELDAIRELGAAALTELGDLRKQRRNHIAETVRLTRELDDAHAEINQLDAELGAAREVVEAGWAVERKEPGCYARLYKALKAHAEAVSDP